jgi:hypothetical protein
MTTPQNTSKPEYVIAIDGVGVMAKVAIGYAVRAVLTGELVATDREGVYALGYTVPMAPLPKAEKERRARAARAKAHR